METNDTDADPFVEASQQLQAFVSGPATQAGSELERIFASTGNRIGRELEKAARSGSLSFSKMVESVLRDLARLAIKQVVGGALSSVLGGAIGGTFSGARADGGPVVSGGNYLVGERGPEVFRPASTGNIQPVTNSGQITVNFNLGSEVGIEDFRRSQGQISAMLSRAVDQGRRRR